MTATEEPDFDSYVRAGGPRLKRLAFLLTGDLDTAKVLPRWGRVHGYDDPDAYVRRVMLSIRTSWWLLRGARGAVRRAAGAAGPWDRDPASAEADLDTVLRALRSLLLRAAMAPAPRDEEPSR